MEANEIDWTALLAPMASHVIKTRAGTGGEVLRYIDWRTIADRLNRIVGAGNWQTYVRCEAPGMVTAEISIRHNGEWLTRGDASGINLPKGRQTVEDCGKAATTDALKRAASNGWGIGSELYDPILETDSPKGEPQRAPARDTSHAPTRAQLDRVPEAARARPATSVQQIAEYMIENGPRVHSASIRRAVEIWGDPSEEVDKLQGLASTLEEVVPV